MSLINREMPVRDHGIGQKFQVRVIGKRNGLALSRAIGVRRINLGCRLGGDVRLCARTKSNVQSKPVSLQQAAWNSLLLYVTGGLAFADLEHVYVPGLNPVEPFRRTETGWTVGAGAE